MGQLVTEFSLRRRTGTQFSERCKTLKWAQRDLDHTHVAGDEQRVTRHAGAGQAA